MDLTEVNVADVVSAVVVKNLATGPVHALDAELIAGFYIGDHGKVGMPAIMDTILLGRWSIKINFNERFSHDTCGVKDERRGLNTGGKRVEQRCFGVKLRAW
jgi:hypothetical protein